MALKCPRCGTVDNEQKPQPLNGKMKGCEHWKCSKCGHHWHRAIGSKGAWE